MKKIKPPMLSTAFSQNGKKAKHRIDNILGKNKKMSIKALGILLLITAVGGATVACNDIGIIGGADGPTAVFVSGSSDLETVADKLYKSKIKYVGNASGVGKLIQTLSQDGVGEWNGMALETDKEPYGVTRRYSGTMPEDKSEMKRQAAVMLSLIENAGFIRYSFSDGTAEYTREELDIEYGTLSEHSKNKKAFREFYSELYEFKKTENLISSAIIEHNSNGYAQGECAAEGHIVLGTEGALNVKTGNESEFTVYLLATYGEYGFENNNFVKVSGSGVIPIKITFNPDGTVKSYEKPSDGSKYTSSIKEIFPSAYWNIVLSDVDEYYDICLEQEYKYAQDYLDSIGRGAKITEDKEYNSFASAGISADVSNKLMEMKELGDYTIGIGSCEKVQNGIRYLYDISVFKDEIIYTKTVYDSNEVVESYTFDKNTGELLRKQNLR